MFTLRFATFGKQAVFCAGIAALTSPAFSQDSVVSCADIQDSDARLACYDEAAEQARSLPVVRLPRNTANSSNETRVISSGANESFTTRDEFGLNSTGVSSRTFRVLAANHNDFTGWTIEFENGGKWKQLGTDSYDIKIGETYTIRRGALNSYILSNSNNNRKIRVSRLE